MARISGFPKTRPVVDSMGMLNSETRLSTEELENRIPITGEGSPEGVIAASVGATYYDLSADTGSIHYVKTQQSVGEDRSKGWKLA